MIWGKGKLKLEQKGKLCWIKKKKGGGGQREKRGVTNRNQRQARRGGKHELKEISSKKKA